MIHFDVMDNHFVPNLTIGPMVCQALIEHGVSKPIDVHLMVKPVDGLIEAFATAGASWISIHPEATQKIDRSLQLIKQRGCRAGLALNPETPLSSLDQILPLLDFILLMSVNPGFGGQSFIPETLAKIKQCRLLLESQSIDLDIAVDGGVKIDNIKSIAEAGANVFVMGSAIFKSQNYAETLKNARLALSS